MRLPKTAHSSRPWRVHELTKDFELEDVWELPTPGGPDDLARLVQQFTSSDEGDNELPVVPRALFAIRWKLGKLFGWDKPGFGIGERVHSLRERLPADLLETSLPGIFAIGDVRGGNIKRVASAVGEGSIAISFVHQVLQE